MCVCGCMCMCVYTAGRSFNEDEWCCESINSVVYTTTLVVIDVINSRHTLN
jgi:hypothetical protein